MSKTKQKRKINNSDKEDDNDDRKKRVKIDSAVPTWTVEQLLAEQQNLSTNISKNIIKLFDDGNTIPFIIRYRRNLIGGKDNEITPEILRNIKENYDEIVNLKNKIINVTKTLKKSDLLTENLEKSITSATSIEELEYIYAPYKPENKRSLAQRAKELGLEQPALDLLNNSKVNINLAKFVKKDNKDLSNLEGVQNGIVHIVASIISTDTELLTLMRELRSQGNFRLKSKKNTKQSDNYQFDNYSDFEIPIKYIKPHQILAINRGENLKVLSVKIIIPDHVSNEYEKFCRKKWLQSNLSKQRNTIINQSIRDCYQRLIQPLLIRETRKDLKLKAEQASYEVFSKNLKQLLLLPPLKIQQSLLAVDPGYKNGCKLAVISPIGQLLDYGVIYPLYRHDKGDIEKFKEFIEKYDCKLIILGNGKGCRQFEEWLTKLINKKTVKLKYLIVNEDGASIYSCSQEAKNEFPDLDPNIISAVSLGRRAQDPLAELVKIEPKHLGIGMYQHDLKTKKLEELLNEVVIECVSFVGVDINTASKCLLKHIAGLSDKRAEQIISYRNENGAFFNRQELLKVPGIGKKIFQQCAGFLRINPSIIENNSKKITRFDCTDIHPESYDIAEKLLKKLKLSSNNIGKLEFIETIKNRKAQSNLNQLCEEIDCNLETLELIFDCLSKPLNYDLRDDLNDIKPLFKTGITDINDLKIGDLLTGRIINVTHFGYFIDIGVGINGLIHISKTNGLNLSIGNNVEVKVLNIDIDKGRIQLEAKKIL